MLETNFEELVAAERMADIRRQVAEGRLQASLKDEGTKARQASVSVLQVAKVTAYEVADEAFRRAA